MAPRDDRMTIGDAQRLARAGDPRARQMLAEFAGGLRRPLDEAARAVEDQRRLMSDLSKLPSPGQLAAEARRAAERREVAMLRELASLRDELAEARTSERAMSRQVLRAQWVAAAISAGSIIAAVVIALTS